MGIYVCLHAVSGDNLLKMLERPELCVEALAPAELTAFELGLSDDPADWHSLDKAWHGLHYLYTGTSWGGQEPLCYIAVGGRELEWDESFFEVPPRALVPEQVQSWSEVVDRMDDAKLRAAFSPQDMVAKEIYPGLWHRNPKEDDTLGWLIRHAAPLREFLRATAARGYGLLVMTG
jgi:hypothetical protein